jgi:protein-tyrosine phosphatase
VLSHIPTTEGLGGILRHYNSRTLTRSDLGIGLPRLSTASDSRYHLTVITQDPLSPLLALPLSNSYWVIPSSLLAGEHPAGIDEAETSARLAALRHAGIDCFIDLTEADEQPEYKHLLRAQDEYVRFEIPDMGVPYQVSRTMDLLLVLRMALGRGRGIYVHCRAGIGRTGLIIGCFLAEEEPSGKSAIKRLNRLWKQSARSEQWPKVPQTPEQADYIRRWPDAQRAALKIPW